MKHLEFRVEIWTADGQSVEEVIAACSNQLVARAAFERAVQYYPKAMIRLRHRARVIKENRPR